MMQMVGNESKTLLKTNRKKGGRNVPVPIYNHTVGYEYLNGTGTAVPVPYNYTVGYEYLNGTGTAEPVPI